MKANGLQGRDQDQAAQEKVDLEEMLEVAQRQRPITKSTTLVQSKEKKMFPSISAPKWANPMTLKRRKVVDG